MMPGNECSSTCRCLYHGVNHLSSRYRSAQQPNATHIVSVVCHPHLRADQGDLAVEDDDPAVVRAPLVNDRPALSTDYVPSLRDAHMPISQMIPCASSLCRICARISHECSTVSPAVSSRADPGKLVHTLPKMVIAPIARYLQLGTNPQPRALGFSNRDRLQDPRSVARKVQRPLSKLAPGRQCVGPSQLSAHTHVATVTMCILPS